MTPTPGEIKNNALRILRNRTIQNLRTKSENGNYNAFKAYTRELIKSRNYVANLKTPSYKKLYRNFHHSSNNINVPTRKNKRNESMNAYNRWVAGNAKNNRLLNNANLNYLVYEKLTTVPRKHTSRKTLINNLREFR